MASPGDRQDSFGAKGTLEVNGKSYEMYRLSAVQGEGLDGRLLHGRVHRIEGALCGGRDETQHERGHRSDQRDTDIDCISRFLVEVVLRQNGAQAQFNRFPLGLKPRGPERIFHEFVVDDDVRSHDVYRSSCIYTF